MHAGINEQFGKQRDGVMNEILGDAKKIRSLLTGIKYSVDFYQRDYKWDKKHVIELINDLESKFLEGYDERHERKEVANYPRYFLGSIIISKKNDANFIIDGQQRLTSLTLLIIFLYNLQRERGDAVPIRELIYSEQFGKKSFNLDVKERSDCMESLFSEKSYDITDVPESVKNLYNRYQDIEEAFPSDLREKALPYFIDWLLNCVYMGEITAYSDEDAYTIFETMNDRGLSLSPTDMLKSFLLANIDEEEHRDSMNLQWKSHIRDLTEWGKDVDVDCFKAWFRSQYATKIRAKKSGAQQEDFDKIGTEFHRWVRDQRNRIGLRSSSDVVKFIKTDFDFYSKQYLRLLEMSKRITPGLEHVGYNSWNGFTLQYMLLLSPLNPDDSLDIINKKIKITSRYIDILLTWRLWNSRSISYAIMKHPVFNVMKYIRELEPDKLAQFLFNRLQAEKVNFDPSEDDPRQGAGLRLHQKNRKVLHRILARITDFIEVQSGMGSRFEEYVKGSEDPYEVEHIWANNFKRHENEFDHQSDFFEYRNRIGGLLLLPRSFNASYGSNPYDKKLEHYFSHNLLAKSLSPKCYENNPRFKQFIDKYDLRFEPIKEFRKADIDQRSELYRQIAKCVWDPGNLLD